MNRVLNSASNDRAGSESEPTIEKEGASVKEESSDALAEPTPLAPRRKVSLLKRARRELRERALLVALPLLSRLPVRWAIGLGAWVGGLAYWLVGRERELALAHLRLAFPEAREAERRRIAKECFRNLGRSALELAVIEKLQPRLAEHVRLGAREQALLREAHAEGKGVLFASCHLGNWELLARRIALEGYACGTVAREAQDPRLTKILDEARARVGLTTLWRGRPGVAREMLRLLRAGGFLGLLIDQDTDVQGFFVPFFGRPAHTPRAVGDLAARTGAPALLGCIHRDGAGHRVVLHRLDVPRTGDREADARALTAAATAAIEFEIRACPDEWVWMHRRWRTQPA
jgi:KDO2-lipid IV(A) lauroyltransferase